MALVLLGACTVGGPLPQTDGVDTAPLHAVSWPAEGEVRAVLLVLHGYGDHAASVFAGPAAQWARAGIAVHGYDQRGFGHNPSHRHWPGVDALIDDLAAQIAALRAAYPDRPLFMLGHSMGAGVVLATLGEGAAEADGAILAAPAIAGGDRVSPIARASLWALAGVLPDRRWTGEGFVRFRASDNVDALRRLAADPLYIGNPSAREILGLVRLMDRARAGAGAATAPKLVLIGERDELVDPDDVVSVAGEIAGLDRLIRYPDGWHLLFRDLQAEQVWADVEDWILAQIGGPEG